MWYEVSQNFPIFSTALHSLGKNLAQTNPRGPSCSALSCMMSAEETIPGCRQEEFAEEILFMGI